MAYRPFMSDCSLTRAKRGINAANSGLKTILTMTPGARGKVYRLSQILK